MNRHNIATLMVATALTAVLAGCADNDGQKAQRLMDEIRTEYAEGHYQQVLSHIDSLRRTYPEAVEQRKEALKVYQETVLKMAQTELMTIDTTLQTARQQYEQMRTASERHHSEGTATAAELTSVTLQRMRVDSLQARFDAQVARIKFIHRKMKEN